MKPIVDILEERVSAVMSDVAGYDAAAIVKPTQDSRFGDYQANGVMGVAKRLKQNPRQLAEQIIERLDISDMCDAPEIAGPGFINFRLRADWLGQRLAEAVKDGKRLGVDPLENAPVTVVDFSGPNIAKQMHVGHLRSTIIGDVIARVLEFWYGDSNKIIRQNHVGDWGLQMGMVVKALFDAQTVKSVQHFGPNTPLHDVIDPTLEELEAYYKDINERCGSDESVASDCRKTVVELQRGDKYAIENWHNAREISLNACYELYNQLGVKLGADNVRGESDYKDQLRDVIDFLSERNLLEESDGAGCVFLDGFKSKDGDPLPLIVQKSDGAYLYATTDLAAIRYRADELGAERVIYVTDARQKLHFEMVFACGRKAGWVGDDVKLEHVPFGSVQGEDGRPFKTRSGENIKLKDLLAEAQSRAYAIVDGKNPELPAEQKEEIAQAVGIGAVKYADLSNNLVSDYVFSWDKMLAMEGNTAPYMQYAYARIQSIFRKGNIKPEEIIGREHVFNLGEPDELSLAKQLLRYGEVIETVARDLRPHLLTSYLFDLAQFFSSFYNNCPVLKADKESRDSRVLLCYLAGETIKHGLGLLGISTIEQM